eukprot:gene5857-34370_t
MDVFVMLPGGGTEAIRVDVASTVGELEAAAGRAAGARSPLPLLSHGAALPDPAAPLADCGVCAEGTLSVDCGLVAAELQPMWDAEDAWRVTYALRFCDVSYHTDDAEAVDAGAMMEGTKKARRQLKHIRRRMARPDHAALCEPLEKQFVDLMILFPLLIELHNPAMRPRHWAALLEQCGMNSFDPNTDLCSDLAPLAGHVEVVGDTVERACKELKNRIDCVHQRIDDLHNIPLMLTPCTHVAEMWRRIMHEARDAGCCLVDVCAEGSERVVCNTHDTAMYAAPGSDASVGVLSEGEEVTLLGENVAAGGRDWAPIRRS